MTYGEYDFMGKDALLEQNIYDISPPTFSDDIAE